MKNWLSEIQELKNYYQSLSGKIPDLEKELVRLIKVEDEIGVLVSSRRCLEVIVNNICEKESIKFGKTIPLKGIIDKLNKENKAPSHIITSMLNLNSSSIYGAHPKEFDPRQVRTVLINLTTIIEWYLIYRDIENQTPSNKIAESHSNYLEKEDLNKKVPEKSSKLKVWKIATYFSAIIIVVLGILYIINRSERSKDILKLEKSIAVLPFENWSSDEDYAHIGDAMTDELILQLQYIEDFDRVLSRTSTFQYKDNKKTIPVIAEELGVSYIIEGSIQRKYENVSITVQVIRAKNEDHIWAEEYTGKWKDIFTIQDKIAKQVAEELNTVLSPKDREQIDKKPTENLEAYSLYLKGRFFWHRRTPKDLYKSIDYFNRALELDTTYAKAYAGLADAFFILPWYDDCSTDEAFVKSEMYANKALLFNNNLAEAHATIGELALWHNRDWSLAEKELKLAINLNPNHYVTYQYYYELCLVLRRFDEAEDKINLAIQYNPNFFIILNQRARFHYGRGRNEEALEDYYKVLEIKDWFLSKLGVFKCYLAQKKDMESIEQVKLIASENGLVNLDNELKEIYQNNGMEGIVNWLIRWMLVNKPSDYISIASLYALIGNKDQALEYIEKLIEDDRPGKLFINTYSEFDKLRSSPKFQAILKELGLLE